MAYGPISYLPIIQLMFEIQFINKIISSIKVNVVIDYGVSFKAELNILKKYLKEKRVA